MKKKKIKKKKAVYFDDWFKKQLKNKHFVEEYRTEELRNKVASQIQGARKKRHLSQKKLAKLLRMSQAEVSRIENGEQNITVDTIGKITAGLKAKARFSIGV